MRSRLRSERIVPVETYAIFDCTGPMPDALQRLQHRIFAEWLPSSGYEWASIDDTPEPIPCIPH